jgi:hypothetical protein
MPLGARLVQHFRSPLPPYRGEDLSFLSEIEDRDQPTLPIDDMERDVVHKAAGTVRYYVDAEGFQQSVESLLVLGARRDPKAPIGTVSLRVVFERFGLSRRSKLMLIIRTWSASPSRVPGRAASRTTRPAQRRSWGRSHK